MKDDQVTTMLVEIIKLCDTRGEKDVICRKVKALSNVRLYDPMDCSLPVFSVIVILQARILEWVAISSSRISSRPRDWSRVFCIAGRFFTIWATRVAGWKADRSLQDSHTLRKRLWGHVREPNIQMEDFKWSVPFYIGSTKGTVLAE